MATSPITVELTEQGRHAVAKMKAIDAMPELRREMRDATDMIQPALREAVKAIPSKVKVSSEKKGSLRAAVAMSMKRIIKLGVRDVVVLITYKPHGGKSNLGRVLEGEIPWKHPTYGHDPTVDQSSHPYFFQTVEKFGPELDAKVSKVLADIERKL
jgi:hypothetical protein